MLQRMRMRWHDLGTPRADRTHVKVVELTGWPMAGLDVANANYFLLMAEANCCAGCVPNNPLAVVEVFATRPLDVDQGALRLSGTWHVGESGADGWRYQLRGAHVVGGVTRRKLLAASPLICLGMPAIAQTADGV